MSLVGAVTVEADSFQRSQALRRLLLDAIQSLRPQPGMPAQSPDWRIYSLAGATLHPSGSAPRSHAATGAGREPILPRSGAPRHRDQPALGQVPPEEQRTIAGASSGDALDDGEPVDRASSCNSIRSPGG